jgi:hypothetical protein
MWLRGKRIGVRIARKGIEFSQRLGRRSNYLASFGLAAAMCCYKRLVHLTT